MSINISTGFTVGDGSPIDVRTVVADETARLALAEDAYEGLIVFQESTSALYLLTGANPSVSTNWTRLDNTSTVGTTINSGNAFPTASLTVGDLFILTHSIDSHPKGLYRYSGSTNGFVLVDSEASDSIPFSLSESTATVNTFLIDGYRRAGEFEDGNLILDFDTAAVALSFLSDLSGTTVTTTTVGQTFTAITAAELSIGGIELNVGGLVFTVGGNDIEGAPTVNFPVSTFTTVPFRGGRGQIELRSNTEVTLSGPSKIATAGIATVALADDTLTIGAGPSTHPTANSVIQVAADGTTSYVATSALGGGGTVTEEQIPDWEVASGYDPDDVVNFRGGIYKYRGENSIIGNTAIVNITGLSTITNIPQTQAGVASGVTVEFVFTQAHQLVNGTTYTFIIGSVGQQYSVSYEYTTGSSVLRLSQSVSDGTRWQLTLIAPGSGVPPTGLTRITPATDAAYATLVRGLPLSQSINGSIITSGTGVPNLSPVLDLNWEEISTAIFGPSRWHLIADEIIRFNTIADGTAGVFGPDDTVTRIQREGAVSRIIEAPRSAAGLVDADGTTTFTFATQEEADIFSVGDYGVSSASAGQARFIARIVAAAAGDTTLTRRLKVISFIDDSGETIVAEDTTDNVPGLGGLIASSDTIQLALFSGVRLTNLLSPDEVFGEYVSGVNVTTDTYTRQSLPIQPFNTTTIPDVATPLTIVSNSNASAEVLYLLGFVEREDQTDVNSTPTGTRRFAIHNDIPWEWVGPLTFAEFEGLNSQSIPSRNFIPGNDARFWRNRDEANDVQTAAIEADIVNAKTTAIAQANSYTNTEISNLREEFSQHSPVVYLGGNNYTPLWSVGNTIFQGSGLATLSYDATNYGYVTENLNNAFDNTSRKRGVIFYANISAGERSFSGQATTVDYGANTIASGIPTSSELYLSGTPAESVASDIESNSLFIFTRGNYQITIGSNTPSDSDFLTNPDARLLCLTGSGGNYAGVRTRLAGLAEDEVPGAGLTNSSRFTLVPSNDEHIVKEMTIVVNSNGQASITGTLLNEAMQDYTGTIAMFAVSATLAKEPTHAVNRMISMPFYNINTLDLSGTWNNRTLGVTNASYGSVGDSNSWQDFYLPNLPTEVINEFTARGIQTALTNSSANFPDTASDVVVLQSTPLASSLTIVVTDSSSVATTLVAGTDYTLSGNTVTFTAGVDTTSTVLLTYNIAYDPSTNPVYVDVDVLERQYRFGIASYNQNTGFTRLWLNEDGSGLLRRGLFRYAFDVTRNADGSPSFSRYTTVADENLTVLNQDNPRDLNNNPQAVEDPYSNRYVDINGAALANDLPIPIYPYAPRVVGSIVEKRFNELLPYRRFDSLGENNPAVVTQNLTAYAATDTVHPGDYVEAESGNAFIAFPLAFEYPQDSETFYWITTGNQVANIDEFVRRRGNAELQDWFDQCYADSIADGNYPSAPATYTTAAPGTTFVSGLAANAFELHFDTGASTAPDGSTLLSTANPYISAVSVGNFDLRNADGIVGVRVDNLGIIFFTFDTAANRDDARNEVLLSSAGQFVITYETVRARQITWQNATDIANNNFLRLEDLNPRILGFSSRLIGTDATFPWTANGAVAPSRNLNLTTGGVGAVNSATGRQLVNRIYRTSPDEIFGGGNETGETQYNFYVPLTYSDSNPDFSISGQYQEFLIGLTTRPNAGLFDRIFNGIGVDPNVGGFTIGTNNEIISTGRPPQYRSTLFQNSNRYYDTVQNSDRIVTANAIQGISITNAPVNTGDILSFVDNTTIDVLQWGPNTPNISGAGQDTTTVLGSSQDNFVLTYDHALSTAVWEAPVEFDGGTVSNATTFLSTVTVRDNLTVAIVPRVLTRTKLSGGNVASNTNTIQITPVADDFNTNPTNYALTATSEGGVTGTYRVLSLANNVVTLDRNLNGTSDFTVATAFTFTEIDDLTLTVENVATSNVNSVPVTALQKVALFFGVSGVATTGTFILGDAGSTSMTVTITPYTTDGDTWFFYQGVRLNDPGTAFLTGSGVWSNHQTDPFSTGAITFNLIG